MSQFVESFWQFNRAWLVLTTFPLPNWWSKKLIIACFFFYHSSLPAWENRFSGRSFNMWLNDNFFSLHDGSSKLSWLWKTRFFRCFRSCTVGQTFPIFHFNMKISIWQKNLTQFVLIFCVSNTFEATIKENFQTNVKMFWQIDILM